MVLVAEFFNVHKYEYNRYYGVAQSFAADEYPGERSLNCRRRYVGTRITHAADDAVHYAGGDTSHTGHYRTVNSHCKSVGTEFMLCFLMVEYIGKERKRQIHRGGRAESFYNKRSYYEREIIGSDKAYRAAYRRKNRAE